MQSPSELRKVEFPSIDFDSLCPYWEFFEHEGLNECVVDLAPHISDPVLLLGSGQGIVSEALCSICKRLTNLDKSPLMAAFAKQRRGQSTIIDDVSSFRPGQLFETIIVNTGVITAQNADTQFLEKLIRAITKHLSHSGKLIISYFKHNDFLDDFEQLGLFGEYSNNDVFYESNGDIKLAKSLLLNRGINASVADSVFSRNEHNIKMRSDLVVAIGRRYREIFHKSPKAFIKAKMGFYPYNLRPEDEGHLLEVLLRQMVLIEEKVVNQDTNVLVMIKKE